MGNHQIDSLLEGPLASYGWELEDTGADIPHLPSTTSPTFQPSNYLPKLGCHTFALQCTLRPHIVLKHEPRYKPDPDKV